MTSLPLVVLLDESLLSTNYKNDMSVADTITTFALIGQKEKHLRYLEAQLHQMQQQQPRAPSFASSRNQQPLPITVPSFVPQVPFALDTSPAPPVISSSRTFPTKELKELQRQQRALPKRTRAVRGRARSRIPSAWTSTTALMDLSDYEDEFADALPVPPPFTPYPMPVSYPAPPPPDPLRITTPVPPSPILVSTTPPKSIHTIISPPENTLSAFLTNLTIPDPLPSFMNEGPIPAAPHVSEMDDDHEIQNPEETPRRPPVPPTPFTPYQNQDPKQFFTLDDIPVSKWASQIADFHAWINAKLLHERASTVTVLSKFVVRIQGKLRE
ncbi:vegetative cell wall protein gp1-like [Macadamia integrifolia]|uniref:vegetative cell wall protein gp1-like n=1 Tax=Macadamia integrifolia TaxID=60698 RepID=UPI001C5025B8|nr:vegetative cell wall protein gp1-like [Macadamia integrifolia]